MTDAVKITREGLLGEIEDVLRVMPRREVLRMLNAENLALVGRMTAVMRRWDPVRSAAISLDISNMFNGDLKGSNQGYIALMTSLYEAREDLRLSTVGPVSLAIGQGMVFDYFDEIRKQIEFANTDILFVDRWLNSDFVSRYLPCAKAGVKIRLLSFAILESLVPAAELFAKQHNASIEIRSAQNFHERYIFIDGMTCIQSGASFKDGSRTAPATITQIKDAFPAMHQTYEAIWNNAKIELKR
jgi:hypothetical protein